jgi:isochorismate synthase
LHKQNNDGHHRQKIVEMISTKEKEDTTREKQILKEAIIEALNQGQSFSLWKTPGMNQKNLIICDTINVVDDFVLEEGNGGFAFAPFSPDEKKYLFPADVLYQFDNEIQTKGPQSASTQNKKSNSGQQNENPKFHYSNLRPATSNNSSLDFIGLVNMSLQEISMGQIEKVVPSRFKDIAVTDEFDALKAFDTLCDKHPQALVSLVSSPQTGTWLGATPELLVSVDNQGIFKTIALAGTIPYSPEIDLKSVAWTQKEIEEQALVCRYIINCFKKIRLREYEEHGPRTVVAGNVMHLKTIYEVDMTATSFPQLGSVMLKLLHPTSAVCGMPFENAWQFLKRNEGYNREFYSGYLGPVQINQQSLIFVNLRCMQVFKEQVRLYAGAGITIDSDSQKEFEETEMKMQNLQNLLIS